ncbi:MAG: hypothetical protein NTY12_04225 [Candidatus Falkowbacteria bacterium]|nr:hypothetical protein [Candidatus Falkowbacteria bacterium]
MEKIFESPYLNNKLEKDNGEESYPMISGNYRFGTTDYDYEKPEGSFRAQLGNTSISLDYSRPDPYLSESLRAGLLSKNVNQNELKNILKNVRALDRFVVENKNGCFDLNSAFPGGKVYFNLGEGNVESFINMGHKVIFLEQDPWTPEGLVALLHEVGHYKDYVRSNHNQRTIKKISRHLIKKDLGTESEGEVVLKEERDAWAFALRDLKPFKEDLDIYLDELEEEIHGLCLKSYSDFIKETLGKN